MKRKSLFIIAVFVFMFFNTAAMAKTVKVFVDTDKISFDVDPFIEDGRTLVPVRGVFERIGAKVDWNA